MVVGPTGCVPLGGLDPLQPPEAVQEAALTVVQLSVLEPPLEMVVGLALKVTVGPGATVTVTCCIGVTPPGPLQMR